MFNKKRLIGTLLLIIFALVVMVPVSFAKGDPIMDVNLGTRDLTKKQIEELTKDPEKLKLRSKKDTEYLLAEAEKQMNISSLNSAKGSSGSLVAALAGTNVAIGSNATFYTSDSGNKGKSVDLISVADSRWGSWTSDAYSRTVGLGSASSWAYNSKTINVTGTGSRLAYLRFAGNYSGWTQPGFLGGTASARIRVSVYDLTSASEIGGSVVKDVSDSVTFGSTFNQVKFNNSVLVSLQAGHSYLLRYGVSTGTSNYGPQGCESNFWNDTKPGLYQDNVKVEWQ